MRQLAPPESNSYGALIGLYYAYCFRTCKCPCAGGNNPITMSLDERKRQFHTSITTILMLFRLNSLHHIFSSFVNSSLEQISQCRLSSLPNFQQILQRQYYSVENSILKLSVVKVRLRGKGTIETSSNCIRDVVP